MLPPGWLKLAIRPDLTGSLLVMIRMGIVEVAVFDRYVLTFDKSDVIQAPPKPIDDVPERFGR
jgi:hypothetical protein